MKTLFNLNINTQYVHMNIEEFRTFCLEVKGAEESFPFDDYTLVFKIMNKMFTYVSLEPKDREFFANMKCEPEKAITLRETYEGIRPAFHANKIYWNSVYLESDVPDKLIEELILHSVEEVVKKLPKKQQEIYRNMK